MAVTPSAASNGSRVLAKILEKTQMESPAKMKQNAFTSAGVPDGDGMGVGDLCWDTTNEDAYICTVADTTVAKINA